MYVPTMDLSNIVVFSYVRLPGFSSGLFLLPWDLCCLCIASKVIVAYTKQTLTSRSNACRCLLEGNL